MNVNEKWVLPKKGDLVYYEEDRKRGINCIGVVLDIKEEARDIIKTNVRVLWGTEKVTDSWHRAYKLVVINESR